MFGIGGWFVLAPQKTAPPTQSPIPKPTAKPQFVLHDVPFVSQAPTGRWDDPRQQDGCEEAASYMAVLWARGEKAPTTLQEQEKTLLAISQWEVEKFGSYQDTSATDTAERISKGYFNYHNVEVRYEITAEAIKQEVARGNLVVVPADGRRLGNPYFTQPGPERHMLVVRGYDPGSDEFITNDNGTKRGEKYRYKTDVLMNAIRDYPTGDHIPIIEIRKAMIVVKR